MRKQASGNASVECPLDHATQPALDQQGDEVENQAIDFHAVLEDEIGRKATGPEGLQDFTALIGIDADDTHASIELASELLYHRQLPDTDASPFGVEIDEDDSTGGLHFG